MLQIKPEKANVAKLNNWCVDVHCTILAFFCTYFSVALKLRKIRKKHKN